MAYLFLAICAYTANAFVLKVGELYQQDRLVVMGFNYLFAALAAAALWAVQGTGGPGPVTLALGPVGGFFYAAGLLLWMITISRVGLAASTATLRLSVLWPTLLSLVAFGEVPTGFQWAGVLLTLVVLGLLGASSLRADRARPHERGFGWLLLMFVLMGGVGVTQKLFTELAQRQDKAALLTLIFATAAVLCWANILGARRVLRRGDLLRGLVFGLGNVTASGMVLLALEEVPGVIAFPLINVGVILATALAGTLLWRERPGRLGVTAIALAALAIVLMSL